MQNLPFAGVGTRLIAQIIDGLILGFVLSLIIVPIVGVGVFSESMELYENDTAVAAMIAAIIVPIILLAIAGPIIYETVMISSAKQATLGKIIMKIKVVDEQGQRLTFGASLGRAVVKNVTSSMCILLWLWPLFNDKEQALHDLVAKDYVVHD
jgi:uncharacterized RDD family membrane protein YckC